jgi:hypothetical protein
MNYEYHRIQALHDSLVQHDVPQDVIQAILQGGEEIRKNTKPKVKAEWLKQAMIRMDGLVPSDRRKCIREACACCLGGMRGKLSKAIFKANPDLDSRIEAANRTRMVFGHSVRKLSSDTFEVCFFPEGMEHYRCPCLAHAEGAFPLTYCQCCGGHVKHHLQNALGDRLDCRVVHTVLTTAGKKPCTFELTIIQQ